MDTGIRAADCLLACGAGWLLGAFYGCFRLWRVWTKPGRLAVWVQDVLCCCGMTLLFFLFLLAVADGRCRAALAGCAAAGFIAWRNVCGRWIFGFCRRRAAAAAREWRRFHAFLVRAEEKIQKNLRRPVVFAKKRLHIGTTILYNQHKNGESSDST